MLWHITGKHTNGEEEEEEDEDEGDGIKAA